MAIVIPLVSGLLFGLGLCVAGMIDPARVLGFLDVAGDWNPSLAFVMGGAIAVGLIAFRFAPRARPDVADSTRLDAPLIIGSIVFGVGWGIAGLCPGPALADIAFLDPRAVVFVIAMLAGAIACRIYEAGGVRRP